MESIKDKIQHLNQLVLEGKAMVAFDLYYDDEVVMQENRMPSTIGKKSISNGRSTFLIVLLNFAALPSWI